MKHCTRCGLFPQRSPGQRWCRHCHAEYMRKFRPKHRDLPDEQRLKANARAYANTYKQRGLIEPQPCAECGAEEAQMHHDDYARPLAVRWLCRPCHLAHHGMQAWT